MKKTVKNFVIPDDQNLKVSIFHIMYLLFSLKNKFTFNFFKYLLKYIFTYH